MKPFVRPIDFQGGRVTLSHGGGGRIMAQLIEELFVASFDNDWLRQRNDQAAFESDAGRLVITTDAHVVSPLFFPGGNIGSLAVHGTINDVAMAGAKPLYLTAAFIIEEGFPLSDLRRIVASMAEASQATDVPIVTGDTKVVEQGKGDGVFITTTGVGRVPPGVHVSSDRARLGDAVLVNGFVGDHGVAVMSRRENLGFVTTIESDSAPLHDLVAHIVEVAPDVRCLRDPTRGGVAACLNEIAQQSKVGVKLDETAIPVRESVRAACELLGLDPLNVANEGKLIAVCPPEKADILLKTMRAHPLGSDSAIVGEIIEDANCFVQMRTELGGTRMVDWLAGEQLPRIC